MAELSVRPGRRKTARIILFAGLLAMGTAGYGQADNVTHEFANLKDPDSSIRAAAARVLGEMKDRRAVPPLIAALRDGDAEVRAAVIEALAELKDPRAVEPLISALKDENGEVQGDATLALGEFNDPRGVRALIEVMNAPNQEDHSAAASALGRVGASAVEPLIQALNSPDHLARMHAAEALGWVEDSRAVDALIAALKDTNSGVREAALVGLKGHSDAPGMLLAPFDVLGWVRSRGPWVRGATRDPRVADLLIAALKDPEAQVRSTAVDALGELGLPAAVGPLITLLRNPNAGLRPAEAIKTNANALRQKAASALGDIGDARAVEPLIATLTDPDDGVRTSAIKALGKSKDPRVAGPLISLLKDKNPEIRQEAVEALGTAKAAGAVDALIDVLKGTDNLLRTNAAKSLGEIGDPRAVGPLIAALKEPKFGLRMNVTQALGQIGDPRAVEPLIAELKDRNPMSANQVFIANALQEIGAAGWEPLHAALQDDDPKVRGAAAAVLATSKDPRTSDAVTAALRDKDKDVRAETVASLCRNNAPWVVAPIIMALKDPESGFAQSCLDSPAEIQVGIVDQLIAVLKDPDSYARGLAARTLSQIVGTHQLLRGQLDPGDTRANQALLEALKARDTAVISSAYLFFVGWGESGSEDALIATLNQSGDIWMAGYFLRCGNAKLEEAGRAWLKKGNFDTHESIVGPVWGSDRPAPPASPSR